MRTTWPCRGARGGAAVTFQQLVTLGPMFGYLPEPEKSFLICPIATEHSAKAVFTATNLPVQFRRGHWYVGGCVGLAAMKDQWVEHMVKKWVRGVKLLAMVARKYPQSAFFGFTQSLQAKWQYLCRCVPGVEQHLERVKEAIHKKSSRPCWNARRRR